MEHIKKFEGFLDLFKSGLTMVGERVSKFLGKRKDLKTTKSKSEMVWTWIDEVENFGEFDFRLVLEKLDGQWHVEPASNSSYMFTITIQSKSNPDLNSKIESGRWAFGKLSDFDQMLFDVLERSILEAKVLVVAEKNNNQFVEDFPIEEVEDYLIDLKDLFHGEVQIEFEAAGKYKTTFSKSPHQIPSYQVTIKTFLRSEQREELSNELKVIDSNIRNMGLKVNGNIDRLLQSYNPRSNFRFELIRSDK